MKPLTPPTTAEPVIEMGQEFDSALPTDRFKSVHEFCPWDIWPSRVVDVDATEDQRDCDAMEVRT